MTTMTDPSTDSAPLNARAREAQEAIDTAVRSWRESELARFDETAVKELGKQAR